MTHQSPKFGSVPASAPCFCPLLLPEVIRECAEVPFCPSDRYEHKDSQPLRYMAVRIRRRQQELFADGSAVKHFAVVTNIREWGTAKLLE